MQCQKLKTYIESGRVVFLPPKIIRANPTQPRQVFNQEALEELADSIRQHGILQPLSVRRVGTGYELVAGERRLRAAALAGLVENLQRQDLDFIEEARGISRLMELGNLSQDQTARLLGKSQSAVANKLRLLRHSEAVLDALRKEKLTERHGRALLKLTQEQEKLAAIAQISRQGMSVAQTEKYILSLLRQKPQRSARADVGSFLNSLSKSLSQMQSQGISAVSERRETESQIVVTITIPKE